MRISDWSSGVCSSDLHRADLLALENSLVADMTRKKVTQEDLDAVLAGKADAVPADSPAIPAVAKYREAQAKAYEDLKQRRQRSEERRVGKECVRTCRSRGSPDHEKKKQTR